MEKNKKKEISLFELSRIIIERLKIKKKVSLNELQRLKHEILREYKCKKFPTNIEILCTADKDEYKILKKLLTLKPTRTLSGVTPVAVMAKPIPCPHGKCIFCPGGIDSPFGDVPQSYTGHEPSTMRSIRANYDPYLIVFNRLEQFLVLGHDIEKVDVIIQSGTFCAFKKSYQKELVLQIFKALNDFSRIFYKKDELDFEKVKLFFELPSDLKSKERETRVINRIKELKQKNKNTDLKKEHEYNDKKSKIKCIGLTIETRPDFGRKTHAIELLKLGVTRIELGVQSVYDEVLSFIERGHDVKETINSIKELKDLGFKLNFHYMPGLLGTDKSGLKKDLNGMKLLFSNPNFRPDMLKIYPCMVMPGTKLEKLYTNKIFSPIKTKDAVELIAKFIKYVPKYCRIMRVQRDIPSDKIIAGVDKTNLRQMIDEEIIKKMICVNEIRAHESSRTIRIGNPKIKILNYDASDGQEYFISYEDKNAVFGFVRLRFPSDNKKIAFIRELHVYGRAQNMGESDSDSSQHKGIGKKLMSEAEKISKKNKKEKILVISGVGVRGYYRKLGYKLEKTYMIKKVMNEN
jgi:elongator complex protein 3